MKQILRIFSHSSEYDMKRYDITYDTIIPHTGSVEAESFEDAFTKYIGDYVHREVDEDYPWEFKISDGNEIKYYIVISG